MRSPLTRWLLLPLLALVVLATIAFLYAPYLPALIAEGYPKPEWPARGAFAEVPGGTQADSLGEPEQTTLSPALAKLFTDSGGKALLVYQAGRLKLEHYAPGFSRDTRFNSYSLVKSPIGVLTLSATARGEMPPLDTPIASLGVTPRELLDMKSGIVFETNELKQASGQAEKDLEETLANPFGPMARLHVSGFTEVEAALHVDPAKRGIFSYQNVNTALLASLLGSLDRRLSSEIWRPAGARNADWRRYGRDLDISAYCCLYARARDWLLAARYVMSNGTPGTPLMSGELHKAFLGRDLRDDELRKGVYRFHAWHDILDRPGEALQGRFTYFLGNGGQAVYLMPGADLVVVRFGARPQLLHSTLYEAWKQIDGK